MREPRLGSDGLDAVLTVARELFRILDAEIQSGSKRSKVSKELVEFYGCWGLYVTLLGGGHTVMAEPDDWAASYRQWRPAGGSSHADFWFTIDGKKVAVEVTTLEPEGLRRRKKVLETLAQQIAELLKPILRRANLGSDVHAITTSDYGTHHAVPPKNQVGHIATKIANDIRLWLVAQQSSSESFEKTYEPHLRVSLRLISQAPHLLTVSPQIVNPAARFSVAECVERILDDKSKQLADIDEAMVVIVSDTPRPIEEVPREFLAREQDIPTNWTAIYYALLGRPTWAIFQRANP